MTAHIRLGVCPPNASYCAKFKTESSLANAESGTQRNARHEVAFVISLVDHTVMVRQSPRPGAASNCQTRFHGEVAQNQLGLFFRQLLERKGTVPVVFNLEFDFPILVEHLSGTQHLKMNVLWPGLLANLIHLVFNGIA
jgi:hypothetical protein